MNYIIYISLLITCYICTTATTTEVTRDELILHGTEKISKRSAPDDLEFAANSIVFRPLFRSNRRRVTRRRPRSVDYVSYVSNFDNTERAPAIPIEYKPLDKFSEERKSRLVRYALDSSSNTNDLETAANSIVFKPLFKNRIRTSRRRVTRSSVADDKDVPTKSISEFIGSRIGVLGSTIYIVKRSAGDSNPNNMKTAAPIEDLEVAANSIVFRPLFRSQRRRLAERRARSVDTVMSIQPSFVSNSDDMETAANSIVFKPLFRKGIRSSRRRVTRSSAGDHLQIPAKPDGIRQALGSTKLKRSTVESASNSNNMKTAANSIRSMPANDLDVAANGMVFRPLFRSQRSRLGQRQTRSLDERPISLVSNSDDLETAANSIVFKPLFRNRIRSSRRRVTRSTVGNTEVLDVVANTVGFRPLFTTRKLNRIRRDIVFRPLFRTRDRYRNKNHD